MYLILEDGKIIGSAYVEHRGLYWHIACVCKPQIPGRYHIYIDTKDQSLDLGLCVPKDENFVLRTSIPAKSIPHGELCFLLKKKNNASNLIPLREHNPFTSLSKLKTARLLRQNGQFFLSLSADPDRQGSDQNPEFHYI